MIDSWSEHIPYWRTSFKNGEAEAISRAIASENISQGPVVEVFERNLASYLNVPYVVATTSGSMALLMSLMAAGIRSGDEVIVPNRTWIATAHAPLLLGATVKLIDVRSDVPVIDAELIKDAITSKTRAIIPVHLCGRSADMNAINRIAQRHNLVVIEDAAQALGSKNNNGFLGTQSDMGCFSLSVAKIISTGQGGFIATKNEKTYKKLLALRTQGVGSVVNANWDMQGFNFRFTDILAAVGNVQFELLPARIKNVISIYERYRNGLEGINAIKLIPVDLEAGEVPVYAEFLCDSRDDLINFLAKKKIQCRPFYPDLNRASYLQSNALYPNSELFGNNGLYLPSGPEQSMENIDKVISEIKNFYNV